MSNKIKCRWPDCEDDTNCMNGCKPAAPALTAKDKELEALREALTRVNEIRNSIIGTQKLNWSEHAYPLVAALDAAGFEGMEYPAAREYYGTLCERLATAERRVAELEGVLSPESDHPTRNVGLLYQQARAEKARAALKPLSDLFEMIDDLADSSDDAVFFQHDGTMITFGQIRAARAITEGN